MNRELTLQLPQDTFDQAAHLASLSGFALEELLSKLLQTVVQPAQNIPQARAIIQRLFAFYPDEDILALADFKMALDRFELFEQLLAAQKAAELSSGDASDLEILGAHYDRVNLIKSYALAEAVRRKLLKKPELM